MATTDTAGAASASAPAEFLANQLVSALQSLAALPVAGARPLIVVRGISRTGDFLQPVETVIQRLIPLLVPAEGQPRLFLYDDVVFALGGGVEGTLVPLRQGQTVVPAAPGVLANLMVVEQPSEEGVVQYSVPPKALAVLLNSEPLIRALPRIAVYARRPLFAADFTLLGPGYSREFKTLIHGAEVEPDVTPLPAGETALARLPPHLRVVLAEVCFRADADLTNFLGLCLTGLLTNHFLDGAKGVPLVDGNQPSVGKTLLLRLLGLLLDGADPRLITYTPDDEELQKRICATLRSSRQSVLIFDNAKLASGLPISSPVIEANSMAPEIALRILGTSDNFVRPNDAIWGLTMNQTRVSPDLLSRGLPIRLAYDGPAGDRTFGGPDPLAYARAHRLELLAELAGLVIRWTLAGRPDGVRPHRCHRWAKLIGGILSANGFPDFLANYEEASGEFNADLDDLAVLAAAALAQPNGPYVVTTPQETAP